MNKPLCIYHGGCDDGFASAYAVHLAYSKGVDFHYGIYQQEPPDCTGREVFLVDFSYKRDVMEKIIAVADRVTVLDHHKSAEAELTPLLESGKLDGRFDMTRCGAVITWNYFSVNSTPMPWLFEYIQDRDLWRKQLPDCDQIIMALRSYPHDFKIWGSIIAKGRDALHKEGVSIYRYYRQIVDNLKETAIRQRIGGIEVPVVNCPPQFSSEIAGELAENRQFAACYRTHAHGTTYSLRSRKGGLDVSAIAKQYGGGGHANAAGFTTEKPLLP